MRTQINLHKRLDILGKLKERMLNGSEKIPATNTIHNASKLILVIKQERILQSFPSIKIQ